MGDAYTPGLTVTGSTRVRKTRRLPLPGTVLRQVGDRVEAADVVARAELPGDVQLINLSNELGLLPDELAAALTVELGGALSRGQVIGQHKSFFGLFTSRARSPIDGTLESVSGITGQAVLRGPPRPVEISAYVDGEVVEIIPDEGVVVETRAALIQGIFGLAGEVQAPIVCVASSPEQPLEPGDVTEEHAGTIVVGGGRVTLGALQRAMQLGVAAVVGGGIAYHDVKELLGYDVGVAVTGTEDLPTTLIVTEGFGDIAMAAATFALLRAHQGRVASVNGATQIRAGVIRPEVVIPLHDQAQAVEVGGGASGFEVGAPVRCIRAPYFGRIGRISALPVELHTMPSETRVRVCEVTLDGDETVTVPRANVEVIER
jgi:hypothetical protein